MRFIIIVVAAFISFPVSATDPALVDVIGQFEAHLETLLPSDAPGRELRARVVGWMRALAEDAAHSSLPHHQSSVPWAAAAEKAYVAEAERTADRLTERLRRPEGRSLLHLIGEFYGVLASYEGNLSARFAYGTAFVSLPPTMLVAVTPTAVLVWAALTGHQAEPAFVEDVVRTATLGSLGLAGLGLTGVFGTERGRRLVRRAGEGIGQSDGLARIEAAFWARLRRNVFGAPEFTSYRPEVPGADFAAFFLSRLHPGSVADCELWLEKPPVSTEI